MRWRWRLIAPVFGAFGITASGFAQTARPNIVKTQPNYASYTYFEECGAAVENIRERMARFDVVDTDTSRYDPQELLRPFHDSVVIIGRSCIRKDMLDSMTALDGAYIARIYHTLSWQEEEVNALDRLVSALSPADRLARIPLLFLQIQNRRPVNLRAIEYLYERFLRENPKDAFYENYIIRILRCDIFERIAHPLTSQCRSEVVAAVAAIPDLASLQINMMERLTMLGQALRMKLAIQEKEGLDSIALSAEAYARHVNAAWLAVGRGTSGEPPGAVAGKPLPSLRGKYWFSSRIQPPFTPDALQQAGSFSPREPKEHVTSGKINLLIHLRGSCHRETPYLKFARNLQNNSCEGIAAALRRVVRDHPEVEVTIMSQTLGVVGNVGILDVKKEAEVLADYFFNHYRLPGVLAISETPYFRIDGLDRRRIDQPTEWEDALVENAIAMNNGTVLLIDQEGKAIKAFDKISGQAEFELLRMIEALKRRK